MRHLKRLPPRTVIERSAARRAQRIRAAISHDLRHAREDAGLSLATVASAAGVSKSELHQVERGRTEPRLESLARVGAALGMDLSVRLYPGTGPLIRDRHQAAMIEALLQTLHERWRPFPEVWVTRPVKGVIDLVLDPADMDEPLVTMEAQSELRRLEQQIRWAHAKSEALAEHRERPVSSLLLLRNTRATVAQHATTVRAAYPAHAKDAYAALNTARPWPGPAILWADVGRGRARICTSPPRGITVGR